METKEDTINLDFQSPRLQELAQALGATDADRQILVDHFWHEMETAGTPLIEKLPGNPDASLVTFLWRETEPLQTVQLFEQVSWKPKEERLLTKFAGTDIWYLTWTVSNTLRAGYGFLPVPKGADAPTDRWPDPVCDPFNRQQRRSNWKSGEMVSVLVMPSAEELSWNGIDHAELQGELHASRFESIILNNERPIWIYTPPGFKREGNRYPLVVIFDGEENHSAPHALDAMIVAGKIPPLVAVLVDHLELRNIELTCNADFSKAIAEELVPWIRSNWHTTSDPSQMVLNGCSFGGLCSAYTALKHPDVFGNVVMQSGSCWYHPTAMTSYRDRMAGVGQVVGVPSQIPSIIAEYMSSDPVPVRIYQECGDVENGPPPASVWQVFGNRWFHDILQLKGYDTFYREFNGGHDDQWWRGTFADGIQWVFAGTCFE